MKVQGRKVGVQGGDDFICRAEMFLIAWAVAEQGETLPLGL